MSATAGKIILKYGKNMTTLQKMKKKNETANYYSMSVPNLFLINKLLNF